MEKKILGLYLDTPLVSALQEENQSCIVRSFSGRRFLENIQSYQPALILADISVYEKEVYEICFWLKQSEYASIPLVIISDALSINAELGTYYCEAFIAKPVRLRVLMSLIDAYT